MPNLRYYAYLYALTHYGVGPNHTAWLISRTKAANNSHPHVLTYACARSLTCDAVMLARPNGYALVQIDT